MMKEPGTTSAGRLAVVARDQKGLLVLVGIFVLAVLISPHSFSGESIFLTAGNLTDTLRVVAPVGIMALAMTFVILTAGIDLSVGSTVALSGVVVALLLTRWDSGLSPTGHASVAVVAALAAGSLVGALNGSLVALMEIQPFIITLASMIGVRGFSLWLSGNERIGLGVGHDVAGEFGEVLSGKGLMIGAFAVSAAVFAIILHRTVFGRYVRAIGDNALAARYSGLPVRRVQLAVYTLSGLAAAIAGVLLAARTTTGDPNAGIAMELDVIAVVVIGGTSLAGGKGTIGGTVVGTLIIGILTNILGLRNVDSNQQLMIKAFIIICAVALQRKSKSS